MAISSSFTIYTASDPFGPGPIYGVTGSLITILDACLVNGYTGHPAAGWSHPIPNSGSSYSSSAAQGGPSYACYKQASGSGCTLFVNDGTNAGGAGGNEAWVCGWETITSLAPTQIYAPPANSSSYSVGQGLGQFPLPAQQNTYGYGVVRKADGNAARYWILAADASTMYMWIYSEAADLQRCYHWMFGDIYSFSPNDTTKCAIYARIANNSSLGANANNSTAYDWTDGLPAGSVAGVRGNYLTWGQPGHYLQRNGFGVGAPIQFTKRGEVACQPVQAMWGTPNPWVTPMYGYQQSPNGPDNSIWMFPLGVCEPPAPTGGTYVVNRGRLRGLYSSPAYYTLYNNGQIISGSGDYAGRTFMAIRYSYLGSQWFLETSPTVETN